MKILKSIRYDISWIAWMITFIALGMLFGSDKVMISNESIQVQQEEFKIDSAVKPDTYCSEDGIEYWINGFTKTYTYDSLPKLQYVLTVVYDKNQKPKKCNEPQKSKE